MIHDPDKLERLAEENPMGKLLALRDFTRQLTHACAMTGIHPNHEGMSQFLETERGRKICLEYIFATMFVAAVPDEVTKFIQRQRELMRNN